MHIDHCFPILTHQANKKEIKFKNKKEEQYNKL